MSFQGEEVISEEIRGQKTYSKESSSKEKIQVKNSLSRISREFFDIADNFHILSPFYTIAVL